MPLILRTAENADLSLEEWLGWAIWSTAVLCTAGITHILAVFMLPHVLAEDSFAKISALAKPQGITLLKDFAFPFADPLVQQGVCLYDLSKGMLEVKAEIPAGRVLTFSFHTKTGQVFYSFTDRVAQNGLIDVLLLNESQLDSLDSGDDDGEPAQQLRITAPAEQGFMLVKAPSPLPAETAETAELIQSVSCKTEPVK